MLRRNDKIIGRGVVGPGEKQCPYDGKFFLKKWVLSRELKSEGVVDMDSESSEQTEESEECV